MDQGIDRLPAEWQDFEYRHAYASAANTQGIAWQVRVNREQRGLSREALAGTAQLSESDISAIEDPGAETVDLVKLQAIARAFDCAVTVRLDSFEALAKASRDLRPEVLLVSP